LEDPFGVGVLSNGNIVVSEREGKRLQIFDSQGNFVRVLGAGQVKNPRHLFVDSGDNILVAEYAKKGCIQVFHQNGNHIKSFGTGQISFPLGVCMDREGGSSPVKGMGFTEYPFVWSPSSFSSGVSGLFCLKEKKESKYSSFLLLNSVISSGMGERAELPLLLRDHPEINVNWANEAKFLWNSLHTASCRGGVEIVEELLAHPGIDENMKTGGGQTAVSLGSQHGRMTVVRLLLKDPRVDLTLDDHNGCTSSYARQHEVILRVAESLGTSRTRKGNGVYERIHRP